MNKKYFLFILSFSFLSSIAHSHGVKYHEKPIPPELQYASLGGGVPISAYSDLNGFCMAFGYEGAKDDANDFNSILPINNYMNDKLKILIDSSGEIFEVSSPTHIAVTIKNLDLCKGKGKNKIKFETSYLKGDPFLIYEDHPVSPLSSFDFLCGYYKGDEYFAAGKKRYSIHRTDDRTQIKVFDDGRTVKVPNSNNSGRNSLQEIVCMKEINQEE